MKIEVTKKDITTMEPALRQAFVAWLLRSSAPVIPAENYAEGFEWDEVVDLSPDEVKEFIEGNRDRGFGPIAEQTAEGLKAIAKHGPVIPANVLEEAGIENYGHFQGRVTKRTRTVTDNKHAFLFTWDDWNSEENAERGYGHYAVTETTFRSLRTYFGIS